jgi:hypothetical protein
MVIVIIVLIFFGYQFCRRWMNGQSGAAGNPNYVANAGQYQQYQGQPFAPQPSPQPASFYSNRPNQSNPSNPPNRVNPYPTDN